MPLLGVEIGIEIKVMFHPWVLSQVIVNRTVGVENDHGG